MKPLFVTFEGGEGSGKTTQMALLKQYCEQAGMTAVFTREPGGGAGGDAIRSLLLEGAGDKWHPVTELLLFQAARVEHVERVIRPALAQGAHVFCDRFLDSTLVYQGYARGLGMAYSEALHRLTLGDFQPDMTFYIDIDPAIGLARAGKRQGRETRFEALPQEFHYAVRRGFLALAKAQPQRMIVIDGAPSQEVVHQSVMSALRVSIQMES